MPVTSETPATAVKADIPREWQDAMPMARRYAGSGPRYTSYPTAPLLRQDFDLQRYRNWQAREPRSGEPLSLYVHLPFCRDICYYCACNKVVTRRSDIAADYLQHLFAEIALQSELVGSDRPITQMHWGGGTPTYLDDGQITELMHVLACHFRLLDRDYREYSIELDPRAVSETTVALLKGVGFNRVSLGVQDFDERVQQAVNRVQPFEQVAELVDTIRAHSFRSLSFDLIYGLPHQDLHSMERTLERVIALHPDRIACYNYAHLPERFSSQRSIDRLTLPEPEEKLLLAQMISATLRDAGYVLIGMDHYVLPDDQLAVAQRDGRLQRNFQGYSLRIAEDLLGLGVSAISQIGDFYLQNARGVDEYAALTETGKLPVTRGYMLRQEDRLRRHVIMSLICELAIDVSDCEDEYGIDFRAHFNKALAELENCFADGLLHWEGQRLLVTEKGRPFLRNICMPFDEYLGAQNQGEKPRFSATL